MCKSYNNCLDASAKVSRKNRSSLVFSFSSHYAEEIFDFQQLFEKELILRFLLC